LALNATAELLPVDDVSREWQAVAAELAKPTPVDRIALADRLSVKAKAYPNSWWSPRADALAQALRKSSAEMEAARQIGKLVDQEPWRWIADTRIPYHLIRSAGANAPRYREYRSKHPQDPVIQMVGLGRGAIPLLLPLLSDMSPCRGQAIAFMEDYFIVRVCDMALACIERETGCSFCEHTFSMGSFSSSNESIREQTKAKVTAWWGRASSLSREEGISLAMEDAGCRSRVSMARELLSSDRPELRQLATAALRQIGDSRNQLEVVSAGEVLEQFGDSYCRDRLKSRLAEEFALGSNRFVVESSTVFFLTQHGGKEEWDLLTNLARQQLAEGAAGGNYILLSLWNAPGIESDLGIPALVMAFDAGRSPQPIFLNGQSMREAVWKALQALRRASKQDIEVSGLVPNEKDWLLAFQQAEKRWIDGSYNGKPKP
jgi:hypothetical protein